MSRWSRDVLPFPVSSLTVLNTSFNEAAVAWDGPTIIRVIDGSGTRKRKLPKMTTTEEAVVDRGSAVVINVMERERGNARRRCRGRRQPSSLTVENSIEPPSGMASLPSPMPVFFFSLSRGHHNGEEEECLGVGESGALTVTSSDDDEPTGVGSEEAVVVVYVEGE